MHLQVVPKDIMCWPLFNMLKASVRMWFNHLRLSLVGTFVEQSRLFMIYEPLCKRMEAYKTATYLLKIKLNKFNSWCDYVSWFNREMFQVDTAGEKVALTTFTGVLLPIIFFCSWSCWGMTIYHFCPLMFFHYILLTLVLFSHLIRLWGLHSHGHGLFVD